MIHFEVRFLYIYINTAGFVFFKWKIWHHNPQCFVKKKERKEDKYLTMAIPVLEIEITIEYYDFMVVSSIDLTVLQDPIKSSMCLLTIYYIYTYKMQIYKI